MIISGATYLIFGLGLHGFFLNIKFTLQIDRNRQRLLRMW